MHSRGPSILLAGLATLTVAAGVLLVRDARQAREPAEGAEQFQQLVGGLGLGPSVDLAHCGLCFDPRVCPDCAQNQGPVPCGGAFCPYHRFSVFAYPPPGSAVTTP